ncbi:MAG: tRNA (N6-isopentenyl adenosine(37)-C2)-methylthiotransferase MiaB [Pelolinea sp.]|jgi:tRNA-2-methylthio-N6-dimethylallyladenosine synthase|nr:tRNA (N6-isopentenyl adenosine(37)-C2)-methylthiotransferase MiaB [Pelolinea sp.]
MFYHIWTEGCQMNVADSTRLSSALEQLGYRPAPQIEAADVIVLNTCVVRQSAEEKAIGRLSSLKKIKEQRPQTVICLMGCMVGMGDFSPLQKRFPFVDVFSAPSDTSRLISYLLETERLKTSDHHAAAWTILEQNDDFVLPVEMRGNSVAAFVPIVLGCSHACSYCVIPLRRGREISRPPEKILSEVCKLAEQGIQEITLLGQIVDRYGRENPVYPTLAELIRQIHPVDGVQRIRFLTSHPNWMTDELLGTLSELPKVMPHFELPIQAGDDEVLRRMRRGYTVEKYLSIVEKIRARFPFSSIATDLIVGFPGETAQQFEHSLQMLTTVRPDMTHVARYSPRPGTYSAMHMEDSVPDEEKWERFRAVETLQEKITAEINTRYLGENIPVLFEGKKKERWFGRTPTNKLVFTDSATSLLGKIESVKITWAGPWSMIGDISADQ